jgi:hypothetical protein
MQADILLQRPAVHHNHTWPRAHLYEAAAAASTELDAAISCHMEAQAANKVCMVGRGGF